MLYKEDRSYQYTFFLEDESIKDYAEKDISLNYLRYKVSEYLFQYLEEKFFKDMGNHPNYFYKFTHPDVNIVLVTNDLNKVDELSAFFKVIMDGNKLMEIYSQSKVEKRIAKKYEINKEIFKSSLDKFYDYYILQSELSHNTNEANKKIKI